MALRKKDILCLVNLPDETLLAYFVHRDCKGRDLLKMVCEQLNVLEVDYFGLMTKESTNKQQAWINLRNPITMETGLLNPIVLELSVKFFVEPHHLQQDITRHLFFLVSHKIIESPNLIYSHNMITDSSAHLQQLTTTHPSLLKSRLITASINRNDCVARSEFLKIVTPCMEGWGHTHKVEIGGMILVMVIAREGVKVYNSTGNQMLRMHTWCSVQMAIQTSRTIVIKFLTDDGSSVDTEVLCECKREADSLYRDLTEVYSFYCCDTVFDSVSEQVSRDFKGIIISLFNDASSTGRRYVFDIENTLKETYEMVRRKLYKMEENASVNTINNNTVSVAELDNTIHENCDAQERLKTISDSFQCRLCFNAEISVSLTPCGHMVTCGVCAPSLSRCPLCNTAITLAQKIYLPMQLST